MNQKSTVLTVLTHHYWVKLFPLIRLIELNELNNELNELKCELKSHLMYVFETPVLQGIPDTTLSPT